MFKVKNRKTPLAIGVILESLLLTWDIFRTCVSIVNFERVIAGWEDMFRKDLDGCYLVGLLVSLDNLETGY